MSSLLKKTLSLTPREMTTILPLKKIPSKYNLQDIADTLEASYYLRLTSIHHLTIMIEKDWSQSSSERRAVCQSLSSTSLKPILDPNSRENDLYHLMTEEDLVLLEDETHAWQPGRTYFCGKWSCDRCQGKTIQTERVLKGRDENEEEYGTMIYHCQQCGLLDWCSYHDSIEKEDDEYVFHNSSFLV